MSEVKNSEVKKTTQAELEKVVKEEKIKRTYTKKTSAGNKQEQPVEEDRITLEEIVKFLEKYIKKETSSEAFDLFIQKLNIKSYLPLERKSQILISIIMNVVYTEGFVSELATIDLELRKLFRCLLAYTDMDMNSVDAYPIDFSTYDIFIESGLYDYILSICEKDYKRLEALLTQALSFESVMQVSMNMAQMNPEQMALDMKEAKKFMDGFSSQDLEHLANIATLTDPLVHDIAKMIRDGKV
jgi:hypothetical protein